MFGRKKSTEELVDEFDTTTNSVTRGSLKSIVENRREEEADYRSVEQPKDFEDGEKKGWWSR